MALSLGSYQSRNSVLFGNNEKYHKIASVKNRLALSHSSGTHQHLSNKCRSLAWGGLTGESPTVLFDDLA